MTPRKIMLLGEIGVGKSSIARRLVFDKFDAAYKPTLGVDVYSFGIAPSIGPQPKAASFGDRLIIWDTDGNFGDSIMSHVYMTHAAGALIVGDVTRRTTLDAMVHLGSCFLRAMPGRYCGYLLNKSDLAGPTTELPPALVRSPIPLLHTSARTGENIKQAFFGAADATRRWGP